MRWIHSRRGMPRLSGLICIRSPCISHKTRGQLPVQRPIKTGARLIIRRLIGHLSTCHHLLAWFFKKRKMGGANFVKRFICQVDGGAHGGAVFSPVERLTSIHQLAVFLMCFFFLLFFCAGLVLPTATLPRRRHRSPGHELFKTHWRFSFLVASFERVRFEMDHLQRFSRLFLVASFIFHRARWSVFLRIEKTGAGALKAPRGI